MLSEWHYGSMGVGLVAFLVLIEFVYVCACIRNESQ